LRLLARRNPILYRFFADTTVNTPADTEDLPRRGRPAKPSNPGSSVVKPPAKGVTLGGSVQDRAEKMAALIAKNRGTDAPAPVQNADSVSSLLGGWKVPPPAPPRKRAEQPPVANVNSSNQSAGVVGGVAGADTPSSTPSTRTRSSLAEKRFSAPPKLTRPPASGATRRRVRGERDAGAANDDDDETSRRRRRGDDAPRPARRDQVSLFGRGEENPVVLVKQLFDESTAYFTEYDAFHAKHAAVRAKMAEMQRRRNDKRRPEKALRAAKAKERAPALISFLQTPPPLSHLGNPTLSGRDVLKMMTVFADVMSKPATPRPISKAELKVLEQMAGAEPLDQ